MTKGGVPTRCSPLPQSDGRAYPGVSGRVYRGAQGGRRGISGSVHVRCRAGVRPSECGEPMGTKLELNGYELGGGAKKMRETFASDVEAFIDYLESNYGLKVPDKTSGNSA